MQRLLMNKLIAWKNSKRRKPLILWGARQVGKTWLMKEFGKKHFDNYVYISFYNNKQISSIFEKDYDVKRIINSIEIELHTKIKPNKTLIIFDEIQSETKVLESLKYFCEEANEYAVIAAGSLLGVALHYGVSFPVGKVDELRLYPLSFKEFLMGLDEDKLAQYIEYWNNPEVNDFSEKYSDLLRKYMFIGGMPEVVDRYRLNQDPDEVRELQLSIVRQYEGDFGKHIQPSQLPRVAMVWNSIPMQLAKENKKFFFGQIKKGGRMSEFEIAIQWLLDAGLIYKVNKVTKPAMPLKAYLDFSSFKIFFIDVGILGALSELDYSSIIHGNEVFTEYKGALAEQYVLQELLANTKLKPYYYSSEKSTYETDFLIQKENTIVPIEVKAETNLKSKSLKYYVDKFSPELAIRTSMAKAIKQDKIINIPLWAIGAL